MNEQSIALNIPFLDLHVHLRGTLTPPLARVLAARNNWPFPADLVDERDHYRVRDFSDFLNRYNVAGAVVRRADDLRLLAEAYLRSAASVGCCYVEFMLSPFHSMANGIEWSAQIEALAAAEAECHSLIGMNLIVTALRHHGPDEAIRTAEMAATSENAIVRGFGLTGNECSFQPRDFVEAFRIAHGAGLGLTAHAGEWGDASSVLDTVNLLGVRRIGHALSIVTDNYVLGELAARGVGIEICQSANAILGATSCDAEHPIVAMMEAGCSVVLGTDDPAFFQTSIDNEYRLAARRLTPEQLARIGTSSIELAFCSESTRQRLRQRLAHSPSATTREQAGEVDRGPDRGGTSLF